MPTFDLRIPLTLEAVSLIKNDIAKSLPNTKSSHVTEAIARGLGFSRHATLLATANKASGVLVATDEQSFAEFLRNRGYNSDAAVFWRAVARVAIRMVMEQQPRLSLWGFGVGRYKRKSDGAWETATEHHARFLAERELLLTDGAADSFLRSLVLIQLLKPVRSINRGSASYGLKHNAERIESAYPGGQRLGPAYVPNGALVVAAVYEGYIYKTYIDHLGYEDISVAFNMSQVSIDDALFELGQLEQHEARAQRAQRRSARLKNYVAISNT